MTADTGHLLEECHQLRLEGRQLLVWLAERRFEVVGIDWEAELVAADLTGHHTPLTAFCCVLRDGLRAGTVTEHDIVSLKGRHHAVRHTTVERMQKLYSPLLAPIAAFSHSIPVRQAAARMTGLHPLVWTLLLAPGNREVERVVADNVTCPAELLKQLASSPDELTRAAVARHQQSPAETLRKLAGDSYYMVLFGLAGNPSTPPEVLSQLARSKVRDFRPTLAGNPATPSSLLNRFARDRELQKQVARNPVPRLPALAERTLASCPEADVKRRLALREHLREETVELLARDRSPEVRSAVACRGQLPEHLIAALAQDSSYHVVNQLLSRHYPLPEKVLIDIAFHPGSRTQTELLDRLAVRADLPVQVQRLIAQSQDASLRASLATNPALEADVLELLVSDRVQKVRQAAARNHRLPLPLLYQLAADRARAVVETARKRLRARGRPLNQLAQL